MIVRMTQAAARTWIDRLWPVVLLGIVAAVFARGWDNPFVFDDLGGIRDNVHIRSLWPLSESLDAPRETPPYGRPVVAWSLALTYAVCGLQPWGYHLFSVLVHAANALLVFAVVRWALRRGGPVALAGRATWPALAIASLWAVHPLQTESVAYASQRTELLFAFFLLLTLWAVIRGALSTRRSIGWYALTVFACALGMASKESMVVAPLVVLLYDRAFLAESWRALWRRRWPVYVGLALTWAILIALVVAFPRSRSAGFAHGETTGITAWTYLLTQANVITHYLTQVFWPTRLSIDPHFEVAQTVGEAMPGGALLVVLLIATGIALARAPRWGVLGAWFFLLLAPSSSVVPIVTEIAAERRMYLPLLAIVAVAFAGLWRVASWSTARPIAVTAGVLAALTAVAGVVSVDRLGDYETAIGLYEDAVAKFPQSRRARRNLAAWYVEENQYDKALKLLLELQHEYPGDGVVQHYLGKALVQTGRVEEALPHFARAYRVAPEDLLNLNAFGSALARLGEYDKAEQLLRRAIELEPRFAPAYDNLARLHRDRGDWAEAERYWRSFLEHDPDNAVGHNDLGIALAQQGRLDEAIERFHEAVSLDPDFEDARHNLERALRLAERRGREPDPGP